MATTKKTSSMQGSLFEDDYLIRSLGTLAYKPDVALTELVANAWDAGASKVQLAIPDRLGGNLVVEDDGSGMTKELFRQRWMTLGYDRTRHQGPSAEFPSDRTGSRRRAYGHNGVGRHGLLCFSSRYVVETWRDGNGGSFVVGTTSGRYPFAIESEESIQKPGHGTRLVANVQRNLPDAERILNVLAARFLHDPAFAVYVNGRHVPLWEHAGLISDSSVDVEPGVRLRIFIVDSALTGRTTQYQGVAFWIGSRLVGEPSWIVGNEALLDGRTRVAKRYTAIVQSDDLFDEVLPDWSGFRHSDLTEKVLAAAASHLKQVFRGLFVERIEETKNTIAEEHASQIQALQPLARLEISEFIEALATAQPQAPAEVLSAAVDAVINLEKSRSGRALLEKLANLSEEDVVGLDRLLSEWTVRDALTVLDEIDRRLVVLEAIKKLSGDSTVDELHTLHPLVTQARWLFGPEFDSPEYASNLTLSVAIRKLFGGKIIENAFINERRRPDLIVLADSSLSAVATDQIDEESGLATLRDILIVETKKGGAPIGRDEINQATGYVEDLIHSGSLDGRPQIRAFVVGHTVSDKIESTHKIGDPERGWVKAATYTQLVRSGEKRLFNLKERLTARYAEVSGIDLAATVLVQPHLDGLGKAQ